MSRRFAFVLALLLAVSIPLAAQGKGKGKGQSTGDGKGRAHLAKKNNGCLPPGQANKRYVVGQRLPNGVVVVDLPAALAKRIGAAPAGYRYGIVDGDLVKLAVGTMLVVDAIDGMVR